MDTADFEKEFLQTRKMSTESVATPEGIVAAPEPVQTEKPPMSFDEAGRNTEILMEIRDTVQSHGISFFSEGDLSHAQEYAYTDWQKARLIKAWTPIVQKLNLKVSPWLDVLVAEAICTAPMVALAAKNRELRLKNEEMAAKIRRMEKQESQAPRQKDVRTDGKNAWSVDENGYFMYTAKGVYIKKQDRREKPELTETNYEMLVKHNGKEHIDKVFKIQ